jgi:putative salt-induced outer membrane protein YdiY
MKIFGLLILTVLFSQSALGILNVESLRGQNKEGSVGGINFNFLGEVGNADRFNGNIKSLNAYATDIHEFLLFSDYTYGESNSNTDVHRGNAHLRYTNKARKNFYKEFFYQIEFDEFRSLDFRQILGLGLRSSVLKSEKVNLAIGYGTFYENEFYNMAPTEERFRINLYLSYFQQVNANFNISSSLYFQPDIENAHDYRAIVNTTIKTKVTDSIAFMNNINFRYDSLPVNDVQKHDISYNIGLSYEY